MGSWTTLGKFRAPKVPKLGVLGSVLVPFVETVGAMVK